MNFGLQWCRLLYAKPRRIDASDYSRRVVVDTIQMRMAFIIMQANLNYNDLASVL